MHHICTQHTCLCMFNVIKQLIKVHVFFFAFIIVVGLPETPLMSPVMSPNPDAGCGHYAINPTNGNRFYFPQIPRTPMSPNMMPASPVTPVTTRNHPQYVGRATAQSHSQSQPRVYVPRR